MSDYLTMRQIADKLGYRSPESVRKLLRSDDVPLIRVKDAKKNAVSAEIF